jgi:hypothetical protein
VVKGSEGFAVLHTGGVEVASSNLAGPTIFPPVFPSSHAFPTSGPRGRYQFSYQIWGKKCAQLRTKMVSMCNTFTQ